MWPFKKCFKKPVDKRQPDRYPENSRGDFYVENQVCITCGAPETEAPDLIEHSKLEYGHCYFKRQPQTPDELDRAIAAMQVSCVEGVRYGGKDESILKWLYDLGLEDLCDYSYETWRKVLPIRGEWKNNFHYAILEEDSQ